MMIVPKLSSFISSRSYIPGKSLSEPWPIPIQAKKIKYVQVPAWDQEEVEYEAQLKNLVTL
jgi:hypothetical protein